MVLVVEDEKSHQLIIQKSLTGFYDFVIASSAAEARNHLRNGHFDVFLLDIMLGDGTGFEVLNEIRAYENFRVTPVLFLTVREDIKSKLLGFSLGGDDYIIKPAEPLELRARIDAKLRKLNEVKSQASQPLMHLGELVLDPERQAVWVNEQDGKNTAFDLTPLEFRLLLYMGRNANEPLTREKILAHVWGDSTHVLNRSVDSYVAALRRKLGTFGKCIKSVHGVGYRFVPADVRKSA
jgi:two-component system phosphate regulon response regulator PhoB